VRDLAEKSAGLCLNHNKKFNNGLGLMHMKSHEEKTVAPRRRQGTKNKGNRDN
jgi:hypothetical protein